jgi:hypothetical protein
VLIYESEPGKSLPINSNSFCHSTTPVHFLTSYLDSELPAKEKEGTQKGSLKSPPLYLTPDSAIIFPFLSFFICSMEVIIISSTGSGCVNKLIHIVHFVLLIVVLQELRNFKETICSSFYYCLKYPFKRQASAMRYIYFHGLRPVLIL